MRYEKGNVWLVIMRSSLSLAARGEGNMVILIRKCSFTLFVCMFCLFNGHVLYLDAARHLSHKLAGCLDLKSTPVTTKL